MTRRKILVKKSIFIICAGLVALTCIVVVFVYSEKNKTSQITKPVTEISGPLDEEEYQAEARLAVRDYELFLKDETPILTIVNRKQHLLDITISKQFQDVHLQLVMIADALLSLHQDQPQEKENAKQLLSKIYIQYSWLKK